MRALRYWYNHEPQIVGAPEDALVAFADLARFTTISEALGRVGSAGTERLVKLINDFFEPAIAAAIDRGGDVVGFGGDAITVIFPPGSVDEAVSWANLIQELTNSLDPVDSPDGEFQLQAKVGIGRGPVRTAVVENSNQLSGVVGGPGIDAAVRAESKLLPGEIGVDESVHQAIQPYPERRAISDVTLSDSSLIDRFMPASVLERIRVSEALIDEHRPVTVLFAGLKSDTLSQQALDDLNAAARVVEDHKGTVITAGSGDKGTTLLIAFGAPTTRPDQPALAAECGLELAAQLGCRVGITTGLCFAGRVGSAQRWSYNLMGDPPNTAARLMTKTQPGSVLVDAATTAALAGQFSFQQAKSLDLKGKAKPVRASVVLQRLADSPLAVSDLPLVGERNTLDELTNHLASDAMVGRAIALVGPSGIGKSRHLRQLIRACESQEVSHAKLSVRSGSRTRSYGPWAKGVSQFLGLSDPGPAEFVAAVVTECPTIDRSRVDIVQGALFGSIEQVKALQGLDAKTASELTDAAVADVVLGLSDVKRLLVIDDADNLDQPSKRVLESVAQRASQSRLVIVSSHTSDDYPTACEVQRLTELEDAAARELLGSHFTQLGHVPSDDEVEFVLTRSGGNPQLIRFFADAIADGTIDGSRPLTDGQALPHQVQNIVLTRLDDIAPTARLAITAAAAFGSNFERREFASAFPHVESELDGLVTRRLIEVEDANTLSFTTSTIRTVAYSSAAHDFRKQLHRDIGLFLESIPSANRALRVEELAHHFSYTDDIDRKRNYFPAAGKRARFTYANDESIRWFKESLDLLDREQARETRLDLAGVFEHTGRWTEATSELVQVGFDETETGIRAQAAYARLLLWTEGKEVAYPVFDEAKSRAQLHDAGTAEWVFECSSVAANGVGDFTRALEDGRRQVELTALLNDPIRSAAAMSNVAAAECGLEEYDAALVGLDYARALLEGDDSIPLQIDIDTERAIINLIQGEVELAATRFDEIVDEAMRIGFRRGQAFAQGNAALCYLDLGHKAKADARAKGAAALLIEMGDLATAAGTLGTLGMLVAQDHPERAGPLFSRVLNIGRRLAVTAYRGQAYELLATCYERAGDLARAKACRDQSQRQEQEVNDSEFAHIALSTEASDLQLDEELTEIVRQIDKMIANLPTN